MANSYPNELSRIKGKSDKVFALAGNPNVGKSSIFNHLTGLGVVTANYPGKTVDVNVATTSMNGLNLGIVDLPGTYAIGAVSDDQWVARRAVLDGRPDAVIVVIDATNLARNLYLLLQFIDLGFPVVVALNIVDVAEHNGIYTDATMLSGLLGVPVVPTVATNGKGLDDVLQTALIVAGDGPGFSPKARSHPGYGHDIAQSIDQLALFIASVSDHLPYGLESGAVAMLLLENDEEFIEAVRELPNGPAILRRCAEIAKDIEVAHGEPSALRIARERHGLAGMIANQVQIVENQRPSLVDRLWRFTTHPITGLPILFVVMGIMFATLFYVGEQLSGLVTQVWAAFIAPPIHMLVFSLFGDGTLGKIILWGPDAGIQAAFSVGIPYILVFYLLLAILEDSGYFNSLAFLTDRVMHKIGLHSRSVIPLVAGAGCSVPAILGTRVLTTMRERMIASILIVLIPCSARTAVIMGSVALFVGWQAAIFVYAVVLVVIAIAGFGLNRLMPGEATGLVMEVFPFRVPSISGVLKKTWFRFQEFLFVATPIMLVGSIVLGALYETGAIWSLTGPLSPIVEGWLGLPAVAGLALVFAILRKELALQLIVALAIVQFGQNANSLLSFMSPGQIVTYAVVNTLYIPCLATFPVLASEFGWRRTLLIAVITVAVALVVGGLVHHGLLLAGWG